MSNYEKQLAEFEKTVSSIIDKSVRDLSIIFDDLYSNQKSKEILIAIEKAESLLSCASNIPSKMQIYYDIANAYHDLRIIEKVSQEVYLEKELYYSRLALDIYESNFYDNSTASAEVTVAQYIAMRLYTNLGNAYQSIGRYIVAIDCFENALLISNDFAMASLNLSFLLFEYAQYQIHSHEQNYFHHACYYYYKQTEACRINLEKQEYLQILQRYIDMFDSSYIENFLSKPLELSPLHISTLEEIDYRNYLLLFRFFLNPCVDILFDSCFEVDSISLPFIPPYSNRQKELIGLFNQIKQEYNWARLLWYKVSTNETYTHFSEHELNLIDIGDFSDYSVRSSMLRASFKSAYSLFDRIGFFINEYFEVGLTGTNISFKNVWKDKLINKKGHAYLSVPHPIITTHSNNVFIQAMYWLQKDFYEKESINITTPHAMPIFKMRNDMEHNCLRTGTETSPSSFTIYSTEGEIERNTFRLLKLAREMIIYLCLSVKIQENK